MPSASRKRNILAQEKKRCCPTASVALGPALILPFTGQLGSVRSGIDSARSCGAAMSAPPLSAEDPHAPATIPQPVTTQNCRRVSSLIGTSQHALERPRDERDV